MDKLAVDLEKVLDDFEKEQFLLNGYSRHFDINESYAPSETSSSKNDSYSNLNQPPFSVDYTRSYYLENSRSKDIYQTDSDLKDSSSQDTIHSLVKNLDFKPDLIESKNDIDNGWEESDRLERHLPDIASAESETKDKQRQNENVNVAGVGIQDKHLDETVFKFSLSTDVSVRELKSYLEELESEEKNDYDGDQCGAYSCSALNLSSFPCENIQNKICINVQTQSSEWKYVDKNEIVINDSDSYKNLEMCKSDNLNLIETHQSTGMTALSLNTMTGSIETLNVEKIPDETEIVDPTISNFDNSSSTSDNFINKGKVEEISSITPDESENQSLVAREDVSSSLNTEYKYPTEKVNDDYFNSIINREYSDLLEKNNLNDMIVPEVVVDVEKTNEIEPCLLSTSLKESHENGISRSIEAYRQVLDSKTAISTFEFSDQSAMPSPSLNLDRSELESQSCEEFSGTSSDVRKNLTQVQRPDSLKLLHISQPIENRCDISLISADSGSLLSNDEMKLGKEPPFWIPDTDAQVCMHCQLKFTIVRRRHHCRACGLVLCSKCCDMKAIIEYLRNEEARVCRNCHNILQLVNNFDVQRPSSKRPNPNNPMTYCSTIPPPLQAGPTPPTPPTVMVPVGVLKREGSVKNDPPKQVIFSDGIRPGGDLTELDSPSRPHFPTNRRRRISRIPGTPPGNIQYFRLLNPETRSFIPSNSDLPPLVIKKHGEYTFSELEKSIDTECETVKFAINFNLFVLVKKIILDCCVNREIWCMTTEGLSCVGQDEVVFLLEVLSDEKCPPKDVFFIVNMLYHEAAKGSTVTEMLYVPSYTNLLFGSKEHGGFIFIRPTYQCLQKLIQPNPPYLIALLIHRWETPWARLFPIRLVLRLGAEFRYYPCPLVSIRNRPALFTDVGHTIISLLADFRKYSFSLPTVRGLLIHMEDRMTTILLPRNRYGQVLRAMNNSEENVLAFAGNISTIADSHLVCIQSMQDDGSYSTQAINIHSKPRQVTGASFIVFNGSLKQNGWSGKSNIVEDGLMVQIPSENMSALRSALRKMQNYSIGCGPHSEEVVVLKWTHDDINFNIGVRSCIDNKPLDGITSIRVHNGTDYSGALRLIRWTEVFIIQSDDDPRNKTEDSVDISKLSESIARATCSALVPLLDLLASANLTTLAVRANIDPDNVGYEAGSRGERLPPIYMKSLDNEIIAVINEAALSIRNISRTIVLELVFKVMEQGQF